MAARRPSLVPAVIAVSASAVFVTAMVFSLRSAMRFAAEGIHVTGTVVTSERGSKGRLYATIEYVDQADQRQRLREQSDLPVGGTVTVTYLPDDSAEATINADARTAAPAVALAAACLALILSLAMLLMRWSARSHLPELAPRSEAPPRESCTADVDAAAPKGDSGEQESPP